MPDFTFQPPAAISPGFLAVAPPAAGSTTRPAGPGSIRFTETGTNELLITEGMLPMRVTLNSAGGLGGVNADDTSPANGTGGGGGAFLEVVIGEGVIAYGSRLIIGVGHGGVYGGHHYGESSYLSASGFVQVALCPGGTGGSTTYPNAVAGGGGGRNSHFPFFVADGVMQIDTATGDNGGAGGTGAVGNGGNAGGPMGGNGGAGSYISSGGFGEPYGGGGGGTRIGGGRHPGNGADGLVVVSWPA